VRNALGAPWPAVAAAWLAFLVGLRREVEDAGSFVIGAGIGAALVFLGFAAAARCRTLARSTSRARLVLLSLALGAAFGVANLAANWAIAASHPALRALMTRRVATLDPTNALVSAPLLEEVTVRLFLMSVMAWIASRFTSRARLVFAIALGGSSFVFALLHLSRPMPADPMLANLYRAALLAKYTLAGLPLGWIFWRFGLPYAMLCHAAVNAVHLLLQERLF
jgi:hypothetical protein